MPRATASGFLLSKTHFKLINSVTMANFSIENKKGYSVITMTTDQLDAQTTPELRSELVLLSGAQVKNMILDMSACKHCDTNGLSAILIGHRLCKDGNLILAGVSPEVETILSIQKFDPPLMILGDREEAEARMASLTI